MAKLTKNGHPLGRPKGARDKKKRKLTQQQQARAMLAAAERGPESQSQSRFQAQPIAPSSALPLHHQCAAGPAPVLFEALAPPVPGSSCLALGSSLVSWSGMQANPALSVSRQLMEMPRSESRDVVWQMLAAQDAFFKH
ncbi:hypothetical protein TeGR_g334, partial [Tetraparma gracilis]